MLTSRNLIILNGYLLQMTLTKYLEQNMTNDSRKLKPFVYTNQVNTNSLGNRIYFKTIYIKHLAWISYSTYLMFLRGNVKKEEGRKISSAVHFMTKGTFYHCSTIINQCKYGVYIILMLIVTRHLNLFGKLEKYGWEDIRMEMNDLLTVKFPRMI